MSVETELHPLSL